MESKDMEYVREHLLESARVKEATIDACGTQILEGAALMEQALHGGGKILLCGNGGSAADAQHIAAEFVSVLNQDSPRPALPALALTTDTSFLTANANDFGFEKVFVRQVEALGRGGDVLIGITTSGNSANVVNAIDAARERGIATLVLTGGTGGVLRERADVTIRVPSASTQHIQETHIALGHILCALVERSIFTDLAPGDGVAAAAGSLADK